MRLVSDRTPEEIARDHARRDAEAAIVELTANLLRITRGAGKPYELGPQIAAAMRAMQAHWDTAKVWPYDEMAQALALPDLWGAPGSPAPDEMEFIKRTVVKGALQMAASDLLGQRTQLAAGEAEMFNGLLRLEDLRERNRKEMLASRRETGTISARAALARMRRAAKPKKPGA